MGDINWKNKYEVSPCFFLGTFSRLTFTGYDLRELPSLI